MKTDIHPKYNHNIKVTCTCGNVMIVGSTLPAISTEICSACHPFYTGKQKLIDSAGRVDKFLERVKKAQKIQEGKVKKVDSELDDLFVENNEESAQADVNEAAPVKKAAAKKKPAAKKKA